LVLVGRGKEAHSQTGADTGGGLAKKPNQVEAWLKTQPGGGLAKNPTRWRPG